jgi:peroxiredoxin
MEMNMEKISGLNLYDWVDGRLALLSPHSDWSPNVNRGLALLRERKAARSRIARRSIWLGVAVATACVVLVVLPQPRVLAHRCIDCSVALWQGLSAAPAPAATHLIPPASRKTAPDFTLIDSSGTPIKLSNFRGKVVLLNFWATWCGGCQVEIPWFIEFQNKNDGLNVIGISMDDDGWKSVRPYMREKKLNYTIVIDDKKVNKLYSLDSMPMTVLIDRDGKIAASHVGLVSKADYQSEIEALLKTRVTPPAVAQPDGRDL